MASLFARTVSFSYAQRPVLEGVSLTLSPGDRVGIVAPNGAGKSTLLKLLAGELRPDDGTIERSPRSATVGYHHQELARSGETGREFLGRRTGVAAADAEMQAATVALAAGEPGADDRYTEALERYLALGGADLDTRVEVVTDQLGFPARLLDAATSTMSGGEGARLQLASLLLSRYDAYLLDEPTNDLDLAGLDQLERFVLGLNGPVALVSHDRAFLSRVVTAVAELEPHSGVVSRYEGGWDSYLELKETAARHARERFETYDTQRSGLASRAQRQREWATQGAARAKRKARNDEKDKNIIHFAMQSTEKLAAKARASEKAMERLEVVDKPWEPWQLHLEFATAPRSGSVVAVLRGAVVEREGFTLGPIDLTVSWRERVGVVGANGSGKSTLLGLLLGEVAADGGEVTTGSGVVPGTIGQRRVHFDAAPNVLQGLCAETGLTQVEARTLLAKFGLVGDHLGRPASSLSAGERTRAELAVLQAAGTNLLVLDEPTNHLDLPAIEQLEQALDTFDGTVVVVTHDRQFLSALRLDRRITLRDGQIVADELVG